MKFIFLIIAVVSNGIFQLASAQSEQWDTYMAKFGDKPGSVLVNMGLAQYAPDKRFPYLIITGPRVENCNKQGLPDKGQINQMEEILDATDNFITGVTAKVLAGTFTYNCERLNYYYVKDTMGIRNALARMYNRNYPGYSYSIRIRKDPGWRTYLTFLYPDEKSKSWMENNKLITAMLEHGDSLTQKRDINFELFFRSDTDRSAFMKFATVKGYKIGKLLASQSPAAPYELVISKYDYVKTDLLYLLQEEIKEEIKKYKGFYNGWEAKVK